MKKSINRGFTMIELLIVIAVLAVLAVATISAINPIEQIRRSQDTGSRSDAETLISAVDRYYTSRGYYPWQTSGVDTVIDQPWAAVSTIMVHGTTVSILNELGENGTAELKGAYVTRITATGYNPMFLYNRGQAGDSTYVCFNPKSKSFDTDAGARCANNGALFPPDGPVAGACPAGPAANVFSCLP